MWTVPNSIIRLSSLLSLLSSSVCKTITFCTSSPKWLPFAITFQLQLQSYCLRHLLILSHISATIWLICQILYNVQDKFTKEAIYLPLVQFNLAKQFCLFLAQVSFLQTTILTRRMLLLILLLIIQLINLLLLLTYSPNTIRVRILMNSWLMYLANLLTHLIIIRLPVLILM